MSSKEIVESIKNIFVNYEKDYKNVTVVDLQIVKLTTQKDAIIVYENLIKILISGDFIKDFNQNEILEEINILLYSDDYNKSETEIILYNSVAFLKDCIEKIENLLNIIKRDIINDNTRWIDKEVILEQTEFNKDNDLKSYSKTLSNVISLFYIDFNLNCSFTQIVELCKILHYFKSKEAEKTLCNISNYKHLLIYKVELILHKSTRSFSKEYLGSKITIGGNTISIDNYEITDVKNKISEHYDIYNSSDEDISKKYDSLKYKKDEDLSYKDFYIITKYYHNLNNFNRINFFSNILDKFSKNFNITPENSFDKWSFERSYIYIYNNLISCRLKSNSSLSPDEIQTIYDEILSTQEDYRVKNYYPIMKVCKYLESLIEGLIKSNCDNINFNREAGNEIEKMELFMNKLVKAINKLESCINWSKTHLNWPFQPNFISCVDKVKINNEEHSLFNASAFINPINYNKVYSDFLSLKENSNHLRSQIVILKTTNQLNHNISIKLKQVENISKRNVEILSVFAAITLFTIGNIQIYKEANSFQESLSFMLCFAYAIALFVLLIRFILKENENKNKTEKWVFFILIISTIMCFSILLRNTTSSLKTNNEKDKNSFSIQSFHRVSVDSVKKTEIILKKN